MIIKRRVTRPFVQLPNDLVRDRRLMLDEHGMLHYLLSLPDDWEINLRHVEKYWTIGRDKRKRIFAGLIRVGWLTYEKLTNDAGDFIGARWIIGDEPGPEQSEDIVAHGDTDDAEDVPLAATEATAAPERQGPAELASQGDRATPFAADGFGGGRETRPPQNTSIPRRKTPDEERESTNISPAARARDDLDDGAPPPSFGEVLRLWPADNIISAYACEKLFVKLSNAHKRDCREGIKPYLADCRGKGHNRLCDLRTFIDERRWEKFTSASGTSGQMYYSVRAGTPQAERWRKHFKDHEPGKLAIFELMMKRGSAYTTRSQWPPAMGHAATGPPDHNLTEQEVEDFIGT